MSNSSNSVQNLDISGAQYRTSHIIDLISQVLGKKLEIITAGD
jgi:hypothetical protein